MKKIILFPALALSLLVTTSCEGLGIFDGGYNTITVTYNATSKGYFNDGSRSTIKTMEVRQGVQWGNLIKGYEIPNSPLCNNDEYLFSYWKLGGEEIPSTYRINSPIAVDAVYASTERDFSHDSWDVVIREAEKGLNNLKDYYHRMSFVGLTRDLEYAGKPYKVRVIAEAVDPLADSVNRLATLTFQFENVLPGYAFDDNGVSTYSTSSLRKTLNDKIKNNFETIVKEKCQPVIKYTNTGKGSTGEDYLETTRDYVFIPSLYEMNITSNARSEESEKEGQIYSYYAASINPANDRQKIYYTPSGERVNARYWTRSPETSDTSNLYAWPVDVDGEVGLSDGYIHDSIQCNTALSVAPCFCIGKTMRSEQVIFEQDSWTNIVNTANEGLGALKSRYSKDMAENNNTFVGLTHNLHVGNVDYTVRVIGEGQDKYNNIVRPLTFQFTSVYGQQEDSYTSYQENIYDNFYYNRTNLAKCLDDTGSGEIPDTWKGGTLLSQFPSELVNSIPVTDKKVFNYRLSIPGGQYDTIDMEMKIFPLSFDEYGEMLNLGSTYNYISQLSTPYQYYDYRRVSDGTDEEKKQVIRERRVFNEVVDTYTNNTYDGTYSFKDPQISVDWAHSYLRGPNNTRAHLADFLDMDNEYVLLQPNAESRKDYWAGMPLTSNVKIINTQPGSSFKKKIGVVPAFCLGQGI